MHIFIQDKLENKVKQKNCNNLHIITPLEKTDASILGYTIHIYIYIYILDLFIWKYIQTQEKCSSNLIFT